MLRERLARQHLAEGGLPSPAAVVGWQGAVQAQDFAGALWALAQRIAPSTDEAALLAAFDAGDIIRTHVLRPTWHFVAPEDLRWMLALTGPRVRAACASGYLNAGLDTAVRNKAARAMARALSGGRSLTRHALAEALRRAGIATDGSRLIYLLFHGELEGLICSGPRQGKQFTYALLDDRVPPTRPLARDEALARLMARYVTSHGPATIQDAAWWSGLTLSDVREGLALAGEAVVRQTIDGREYWVGAAAPRFVDRRSSSTSRNTAVRTPGTRSPRAQQAQHQVLLLPSYDEYTVAYRDRSALLHDSTENTTLAQSALLSQPVMLDGRHVGAWRRTIPARTSAPVRVDVRLLQPLTTRERDALDAAVERYARFLGRPATWSAT